MANRPKTQTTSIPVVRTRTSSKQFDVDEFFVMRGGILPTVYEGINYTNETISYATRAALADRITDKLTTMLAQMGIHNYFLIECCAGIGGNTISFGFAQTNPPYLVVSFEKEADRFQMLQANLNAYGINYNDTTKTGKVLPQHATLTNYVQGLEALPNVYFFDPPWLHADFPGQESTMRDYIREDIQVGGHTLEHWLDILGKSGVPVPLVMFRVPVGYNFKEVPGWKLNFDNLDASSLLLSATPEAAAITTTTLDLTKLPRQEDEAVWAARLRDGIVIPLVSLVEPDRVADFITPEAMQVWRQAFTHKSVNRKFNYERLEFLGDFVLDFAFNNISMEAFPEADEDQLTQVKNYYMGKPFQSRFSNTLKFPDYLRVRRVPIDIDKREDVFESFFGALATIAQKLGIDSGMLARRLLAILFKQKGVVLDIETHGQQPDITQVEEIYHRLNWGNTSDFFRINTGVRGYTATIVLTPQAERDLKEMGKTGIRIELAHFRADNYEAARENAYSEALKVLKANGITREFATEYKRRKDLEAIPAPILAAARARALKEGFSDIYIARPRISKGQRTVTSKQVVLQLLGVIPGEKDGEVLIQKEGDFYDQVRVAVVEAYAKGENPDILQ